MQILENVLIVLVIINFILLLIYKSVKSKYIFGLSGIIVVTVVLHVIFEDIKWQLYPLYLGLIVILIINLLMTFKNQRFFKHRILKIFLFSLLITLVFITSASKYAFPVYDMPIPSGEYEIGTESFVLEDSERGELYGDETKRRIKIQAWYPALTTDGYKQVPWLEDGKVVARALAKDTGLPAFVLDHTALIMSNSYQNAPISDTSNEYPIVVISHGWRGFRNLHTDLAEELASLGYFVIGIDHTYGSVATVFSDDDISYLNLDALRGREENDDFLGDANTLVSTYAGDITLTINELEKMNDGILSSQFEGKLDMDNIGLIGHSTGGGAGALVAINDERVKAIFGMDSWVEPISDVNITKGLNIPTVFVRSESWEDGPNNVNLLQLVDDNLSNTRLYQIQGTTHYDFSMAYMYSPLTKPLGMTGELEGDYLLTIFNSMMYDFFEQTLKVDNDIGLIIINDSWDELIKIK
jgi:predicted dienelactone hydrolase